ncbi:MAG TPA: ankyrin repeat domain-containing protein [Terracidiphilus sp.]|jgi:ankyrin repeat protein
MKLFFRFRSLFSRHSFFLALAVSIAASNTLSFAEPIHDAARKGDMKKLKELLQSDPKLVSAKDNEGDTPLHVAVLHGQLQAAQALIDAGADVNAKNNYPPFIPDDLNQFYASSNHADPVILLQLQSGHRSRELNSQGVDARELKNGYTPLDLAEFASNHNKIMQLLVSHGADVNARAASGATPLFWAVMRDQKDDAKFLLEHGANPNTPDAYSDTILDCALRLGFQSMVGLLVDKGADVNAQDQSLHRPLTYALQGNEDTATAILKKHGAHE